MTDQRGNAADDDGAGELPEGYPAELRSNVVLADGGTVYVRPMLPTDGEGVRDLFERLSRQSRYFRFFSPKARLTDKEVEHFSVVDYHDRSAVVAELGHQLLGAARWDRTGDDTAEVAFEVDDAHQGRGIGTVLLEYLAAAGRREGYRTFEANVLPENRRMLRMFHDAGWHVHDGFDEGVITIRFPIEPDAEHLARVDDLERRAQARSIARVLEPRSVALIGATDEEGHIGRVLLENLARGGYAGPIYPVNPHRTTVGGRPCVPNVAAIDDEVDLAVVAVPAAAVPDVARQCATKGVGALVVVSAGFSEIGEEGARREEELLAIVRSSGMRLVGPNCIGVANTACGLDATFSPIAPTPGRVAFQTQSGGLGIALLDWTNQLGLGISSFVSVGNKTDVSGNDLIQYWEEDDETDVILMYLESFGNPRKFAHLARRVAQRKPLVAVKSGRTAAGQRAAASHTAAAASADVLVSALFRQAGVIRVDTVEELFDTALLLATQPLPAGNRVAIMGNSGGPGILAADACEGAGLEVTRLSGATATQLRELLGPNAAVANPVDMVASASPRQYQEVLALLLADEHVDAVIVIYTPPMVTRTDDIAEAIAAGAEGATKPVVANFLASRHAPAPLAGGDGRRRIPSYPSPEPAAVALARSARYQQWRGRDPGTVPTFADLLRRRARRLVEDAVAGADDDGRWLDLDVAAELLGCYGIPFVPTRRVAGPEEAVLAAEAVGYPVVVKAVAGAVVHKSDVGGVAVDLAGPDELRAAVATMQEALGELGDELVVQPMVADGHVETIAGIVHDRSFGPLVMFGIGGVATELLADRNLHILPLTDTEAAELVRGLRASPLLTGYRGAPPVDVAGLEGLLLRLSALAIDLPEIEELDLNPVLASPSGVVAVDVRVRARPFTPGRPELLRSVD